MPIDVKRVFGVERLVTSSTPRGPAFCEECIEELDYDYGSIRWQHKERDLCGSCAGKEAAAAINAAVLIKSPRQE